MAQNNSQPLCKLSDLVDPSSKSFQIKIGRKLSDFFVVRKGDQVFAYQNICPHAQAPLEWNPDEFLDDAKENIICSMHGAKFSIEEGKCIAGLCSGASLQALELELINGEDVFLCKN